MQNGLEMFVTYMQELAIGTGLNRCADILLADQAHFPELLALLEGGDGNACIVENVDLSGEDNIKMAAGVALAEKDLIFFEIPQVEVLDDAVEVVLINSAEKGKIAHEVEYVAQMVTDVVGFVLSTDGSEMFQPDGTGTAGTGEHAVGNLIGPFVLNDDFGQVAVEYFATATVGRGMDHGGIDKGVFPVAFHADGDSGNLKNVAVAEERAMSGFTDVEAYFGETHQYPLERSAVRRANAHCSLLTLWGIMLELYR